MEKVLIDQFLDWKRSLLKEKMKKNNRIPSIQCLD